MAGLGLAIYDIGERRVLAVRPVYDAAKLDVKAKEDEYAKYLEDEPNPDYQSTYKKRKFQEEIEDLIKDRDSPPCRIVGGELRYWRHDGSVPSDSDYK